MQNTGKYVVKSWNIIIYNISMWIILNNQKNVWNVQINANNKYKIYKNIALHSDSENSPQRNGIKTHELSLFNNVQEIFYSFNFNQWMCCSLTLPPETQSKSRYPE